MATYWTRVLEFYDYICHDTDPRLKEWVFMESPVIPSLIMLAYILMVFLGPVLMEKRKPMELKRLLAVYSFSMALLSVYIVREFLLGGWLTDYTLGCQLVDYSNSPQAIRMAGVVWLFFIAKLIELLDTVFFILRKKNSQVTFLHVFHHGCLPMFWWWGVKAVPGGFGTFHALVNACVHVVMYTYYGISALGPKYRKYLWWKRYVTLFQLAQFFIVTLHNSQYLFTDCAYPWKYVAFIQGFTTIVAVLFFNFYFKTYRKGAQAAAADDKHKLHSNGHAANGYKNGYVKSNGYTNGHDLRRRKLWEK